MPPLSALLTKAAVDARGVLAVLLVLLAALVLGRLLVGRLAALPVHSAAERWLAWSLAGVIAFSATGVVLASLRLFYWWAILLVLAGVVFFSIRLRPREVSPGPGSLAPTPRIVIAACFALLAGALWLFARPAESFFLVDDSAVYMLGGVALAHGGSLTVDGGMWWPVTSDFARAFYVHNLSGTLSRFYGPFYQYFIGSPQLEIGFLPLPKVWPALMTWLLGPAYAPWATPLFGVLGIAALYGLVRRASGWAAGLIAALLLAVSLPQIWFARYPISEIYAQVIVLGGLYLLSLARTNSAGAPVARGLAAWSALCFALLTVTRLESVILLPLFAAVLLLAWGKDACVRAGIARMWLIVLAVTGVLGLLIAVASSRSYLFDQSLRILTAGMTWRATYAAVVLAILGSVLFRRRAVVLAWFRRSLPLAFGWLTVAVGAVWILWALLGVMMLVLGRLDATSTGWLGFYLSPLGLLLGAGGVAYLVLKQLRGAAQGSEQALSAELLTLLLVAGVFLVIFSGNPLVARWQPWAVRRLVPFIMPALAAGGGVLLAAPLGLPQRSRQRVRGGALAAATAAATAAALLTQLGLELRVGRPILFHRELQGYAAQLETINASFPDKAILVFDNGLTAQGLPQAFELALGRPAQALPETPTGSAAAQLDRLIERAQSEGRPVFFVATDGTLGWQPDRWELTPAGMREIVTQVLRPPEGRAPVPGDIVLRRFIMDVYEVKPRSADAGSEITEVPAGAGSYPYLREGFYGWEEGVGDRIARWTDGSGYVVTPWPAADPMTPVGACLRITVSGGRSADAAPAGLTVSVEGVAAYKAALAPDWTPHELSVLVRDVRNAGSDSLEIRLDSNTWQAPGDTRTLGVMFYGLQVLPLDACPE